MNPPEWQKEESRIFLRDLFFLLLSLFISVSLAEFLLLNESATAVDRIFTYLILFIPVGTLNLIAHYYYRNRRIRVTGNLRSSLRYRLSLAFMLTAVIPSIPIFLVSSNMVEELVKVIFRVDVGRAFQSAERVLAHYREQERSSLLGGLQKLYPQGFSRIPAGNRVVKSLFAAGLLSEQRDFSLVVRARDVLFSSSPVINKGPLPKELRTIPLEDPGGITQVTVAGRDYLFVVFPLASKGDVLLVGKRLHAGFEEDLRRFQYVQSTFHQESSKRDRIPYALRLSLGLLYVFMICFCLVMAWVIAKRISTPIVSLAQATRDVTDGKLDTRIDIQAPGELGVLIDSFNQMTAELRSLRARLLHSQRMAAWQEVARRLAHEIKNPLTPIQLFAERMLRRLKRPERGDLARVVEQGAAGIVQQVNVLKILVKEFAEFARMPEARPMPQDLDSITEEAVTLFRGASAQDVRFRGAGDLPRIPIDKNLFIGMLNNLIKNAQEAAESVSAEERTGPPRVRVSTALAFRGVRRFAALRVEDNGPGVPEHLRDRIFEPYFSTKGRQGSGLGLSLVERAVLEHDARISVGRSAELGGAEFTVLFPIYPAGYMA